MSTVIYHNHHIIPKYRCKEMGIDPDFEGNTIRLTRLEHADAHYQRWLKHKDPRDLGAAQLLALGEIDGIDSSGKNNAMYGKRHSPESIKMMSENYVGMTGKKQSEYQKKRMSEVQSGKIVSEETRKKMSKAQKARKRGPYTKKH
jgi:hypothetical protein